MGAKRQRRIHKKPSPREVAACRPWLEAEIRIVKPEVLICLGATAAAAVLGPKVRILRDRGRALSSTIARNVFVTVHPSMILCQIAKPRSSNTNNLSETCATLTRQHKPTRRKKRDRFFCATPGVCGSPICMWYQKCPTIAARV